MVFKNSGGAGLAIRTLERPGAGDGIGGGFALEPWFEHPSRLHRSEGDVRAGLLECQGTPCATPTVLVESGNRLPGIPRRSLFGEVAWHHAANGFHTALEVIARDKMYVEDTNTQKAAPGYLVANLRSGSTSIGAVA